MFGLEGLSRVEFLINLLNSESLNTGESMHKGVSYLNYYLDCPFS